MPGRKPTKAQALYLEALADEPSDAFQHAYPTRRSCRKYGWVAQGSFDLTVDGWAAIGRTPGPTNRDRPFVDALVADQLLARAERMLDDRAAEEAYGDLDGGSLFEGLLVAAHEATPPSWVVAAGYVDDAMQSWVGFEWGGVIHGVKEARVGIAREQKAVVLDQVRLDRIAGHADIRVAEILARIEARLHVTTVEPVGDEWEWRCTCGEEATGYEDRNAADAAAQQHTKTS